MTATANPSAPVRRKVRGVAKVAAVGWLILAVLALIGAIVSQSVGAIFGALAVDALIVLYARYLFRGGRFVFFIIPL